MKHLKTLIFVLAFGFIVMIPKDSYALTVYSESFTPFQQTYTDNSWFTIESNFNNSWANAGSGYLRFQFTMIGLDQDNADSEGIPFSVHVQNAFGNKFICDIGSVNVANSTYNNAVYSAMCPVSFYNGAGLKSLHITIIDAKLLESASYNHGTLYFDGNVTLEVPSVPNNSDIIASQQQQLQKQQEQLEATKDIDNTLKDNNITDAENEADNLINNPVFEDTTGLNNIVSLPLDFINTIGNTCTPLNLTIPFIDTELTLPCFSSVLSSKVPTIYNVLVVVINGFILYMCCLDIFRIVRNAKNPNNDRIEVLDL